MVPVALAVTDSILYAISPQTIWMSGLTSFQYFIKSASIYYLFVLPFALGALPLFFITRITPSIRGRNPRAVYNAVGASLCSIIILSLFELFNKLDVVFFNNLIAVSIAIFGGLVSLAVIIYLAPLIIVSTRDRASRIVTNAILVVKYGSLLLVALSLLFTFLPVFFKPDYEVEAPNLLVISIDTLRKDHISYYGYDGVETPNIDGFLESSTRFDNAYCSSPWTFPSFSSFLTGYRPSVCGVDHTHTLSDEIVTLTEILRDIGYRTECYNTNWSMDPGYGFGRGFDIYTDRNNVPYLHAVSGTRLYLHLGRVYETIARKIGRYYEYEADYNGYKTIASLQSQGERPFFIWCNFFDPHTPYAPPDEFIDGDAAYVEDIKRRGVPVSWLEFDNPQLDIEALTVLYDGEIAHVDEEIGRILRTLDETGRANDTVVVIFSDHGEAFREHGWWGHGFDVFPPIADMLFAIRDPFLESPAPVSNQYISHVDIMPTILTALGLTAPGGIQGESFYDELTAPKHSRETVLCEYAMEPFDEMKGIRRNDYLFVRDFGTSGTALYDIERDPGARNDISETSLDIHRDLSAELDRLMLENERLILIYSGGREVELTEKDKSRLKAIGYLGK
ncbi:MAG: sulfatase [bacterium]|nr:sulfatase [bacterium]